MGGHGGETRMPNPAIGDSFGLSADDFHKGCVTA